MCDVRAPGVLLLVMVMVMLMAMVVVMVMVMARMVCMLFCTVVGSVEQPVLRVLPTDLNFPPLLHQLPPQLPLQMEP